VDTLATERGTRLMRNTSGQRRLNVDFIDNSAKIASLTSTQCPPETPSNALCQLAWASYNVSVVDEDAAAVSEVYTNVTQTAIDDGSLQTKLEKSNPNSVITITEPSALPTVPPTGPPTSPPNASDGLSTGAIAGIAVSGAVIMLGAGLTLHKAQRSKIPRKISVRDYSVDGGGNYDTDTEKEKRSNRSGDDVAAGTMWTVAGTADDFNRYAEDDYSYLSTATHQSGYFDGKDNSGFTWQTAPTSKLEDYKFDEPIKEKDVARTTKALAPDYNNASNAGSSGGSSSEKDTVYIADHHDDGPVYESSRFNPKAGSIESREEPGSMMTSGSESNSGSSQNMYRKWEAATYQSLVDSHGSFSFST
jgi:hypothetical protein